MLQGPFGNELFCTYSNFNFRNNFMGVNKTTYLRQRVTKPQRDANVFDPGEEHTFSYILTFCCLDYV